VNARLSEHSIRLRLSEFDVAAFLEGRAVTIAVTDGLVFSLVPGNGADSWVENTDDRHTVTVPVSQVVPPSMVAPGMYESPAGQRPHILVEMDKQS
jgi:hypothetical protein